MESASYQQHDHRQCIEGALQTARALCHSRGLKLTPLRQQVLELIWQSHRALGAYDLMALLGQAHNKRIAPPTVYRALEFLQELGLVHRITSLNAYVGCCQPDSGHPPHFLICRRCQLVQELDVPAVDNTLQQTARQYDFAVDSSRVEITGLCPNCQQGSEQQDDTP